MSNANAIPRDQWRYTGSAGHWIMGRYCRWHLRTEIGSFLVSTVGEAPDRTLSRPDKEVLVTTGIEGETYETMTFPLSLDRCMSAECDCGERIVHDWGGISCKRTHTRGEAQRAHDEECERVARKHDSMLAKLSKAQP